MHHKGFSLIEVIVAISVLLIVVIAFGPLISQGFDQVFRAGRQAQAINEAEEMVESARKNGGGFDSLDLEAFPDIEFGSAVSMEIDGKQMKIEWSFEGVTVDLNAFLPTVE